jgi:hypothetical protein
LTDTKASDASHLTLLHVLIDIVRRQYPEFLDFVSDLKTVPEATRSKFHFKYKSIRVLKTEIVMSSIREIAQQYTEMRHGLKHLGDELDKHWKTLKDSPHDRFYNMMEEYRNSALSRFEELELLYVNVQAKWKDTMSYYGENPKEMDPGEFFSVFSQFLCSWRKAILEETRYRMKKEKEEKRKQAEEEKKRKKKKQLVADSELDIEDRFQMDKLLDKLRSGETNTKLKERRVRRRKLHRVNNSSHRHHHKRSTVTRSASLRSNHSHSSNSSLSSLNPSISAEDMLRTLQQEEEKI